MQTIALTQKMSFFLSRYVAAIYIQPELTFVWKQSKSRSADTWYMRCDAV